MSDAHLHNEIKAHPLDGRDEWACYDQHITERNRLISGKRDSEDGFIKTIIQLSSGIILIIPGFLGMTRSSNSEYNPSILTIFGLILASIALMTALIEQFLSSIAYDKQIAKTDAYYKRETSDVSPPPLSHIVRLVLFTAFGAFLLGTITLSVALLLGPWRM